MSKCSQPMLPMELGCVQGIIQDRHGHEAPGEASTQSCSVCPNT